MDTVDSTFETMQQRTLRLDRELGYCDFIVAPKVHQKIAEMASWCKTDDDIPIAYVAKQVKKSQDFVRSVINNEVMREWIDGERFRAFRNAQKISADVADLRTKAVNALQKRIEDPNTSTKDMVDIFKAMADRCADGLTTTRTKTEITHHGEIYHTSRIEQIKENAMKAGIIPVSTIAARTLPEPEDTPPAPIAADDDKVDIKSLLEEG